MPLLWGLPGEGYLPRREEEDDRELGRLEGVEPPDREEPLDGLADPRDDLPEPLDGLAELLGGCGVRLGRRKELGGG